MHIRVKQLFPWQTMLRFFVKFCYANEANVLLRNICMDTSNCCNLCSNKTKYEVFTMNRFYTSLMTLWYNVVQATYWLFSILPVVPTHWFSTRSQWIEKIRVHLLPTRFIQPYMPDTSTGKLEYATSKIKLISMTQGAIHWLMYNYRDALNNKIPLLSAKWNGKWKEMFYKIRS